MASNKHRPVVFDFVKTDGNDADKKKKGLSVNLRWQLLIYDLVVYVFVSAVLCIASSLTLSETLPILALGFGCLTVSRLLFKIYGQIWRYGGIQSYLRIMIADGFGYILFYLFVFALSLNAISITKTLSFLCVDMIIVTAIRMAYRFFYQSSGRDSKLGSLSRFMLRLFGGIKEPNCCDEQVANASKIKIAIVGAGRVGVGLANELLNNPKASYRPVCFIDNDPSKIGRSIYGIPVLSELQATFDSMGEMQVQEIVFALPQLNADKQRELYEYYKKTGCRIKNYDYPTMQTAGTGKRHLREFEIEELLFRRPIELADEKEKAYYNNKVVMITGGGGSIGSELCRQIAKMSPKRLIILDVYENGAYDIQQELKTVYGADLDLCVEIISVCDRTGLEKVFKEYRPQILLHAAAHKHVPLMEHNCCEAVKNNVFGTLNTVELAEQYGVERFMMISTDKAVNPTNIMGATKRLCEMIVQSHVNDGSSTVFSATRFGNVLGSAGSVIPLFKRQIANGGPITLTDRRIIRYFMTIPEASQLVLQSGCMAKNGELFVLDMGKPIKILELAENMIRLSGLEPYTDIDIIETGLRPGEKLYEELLIKSETLTATENNMIFIEKDAPLSREEISAKLDVLREALLSEDDNKIREAMHRVLPTYKTPEEINKIADDSAEMKIVHDAEMANR